jgi:hypothetical protein
MVHLLHRRDCGTATNEDTAMTLPIAASVATACLPKLCDKLWQIFNKGDGTATIKLDGPYELRLNEKNSEIKIVNTKTHEETKIHGDPHVDYNKDGKTDFDFWGTTTFKLEDGTKITINTEPWKGNANMFVANNIVVTKGEQSLVIDGLSQNKFGDLKIHQGLNGRQLDRMTPDGKLTLRENPNGVGWLNEKGQMVSQDDGNRTKIDPHKPQPPKPDFCKQLETMFHQGMQDASKMSNGKRKGGDSWYAAMASALGTRLDQQAAEITRLSDLVAQQGGQDDPSTTTDLTAASQRMGFISNGAMTAINSVGEALSTMARKG